MAGRFVAVVGALAIALSVAGLWADAARPGPVALTLHAQGVPADASGSYTATASSAGPLGVCVIEPCAPRTRITLQLRGLPPLDYTARLQGPQGALDLGALAWQDGAHVLTIDRAEDHTDKRSLVLLLAGLPLHAWPVQAGEAHSLAGPVLATLALPELRMRLDEIGAVSVSTTATASTDAALPEGLHAVARLYDGSAFVEVGRFEEVDGRLVLDGRVERVRLAGHDRAVVVLQDGDDPMAAFPVWAAPLPSKS